MIYELEFKELLLRIFKYWIMTITIVLGCTIGYLIGFVIFNFKGDLTLFIMFTFMTFWMYIYSELVKYKELMDDNMV